MIFGSKQIEYLLNPESVEKIIHQYSRTPMSMLNLFETQNNMGEKKLLVMKPGGLDNYYSLYSFLYENISDFAKRCNYSTVKFKDEEDSFGFDIYYKNPIVWIGCYRAQPDYIVVQSYIDSEELRLENGRTPMRFKHAELRSVDGLMALTGSMFADTSTGWALVHIRGEKCSSQTVVTHCTLYEQYTSEEALMIAAESYGGLTETPFLKPDTD